MTVPTSGDPLGTATAPGKVILLGEHAVVYGQPALAIPVTAVEARATVWAAQAPLTIHAHLPLREGGTEQVIPLDDAAEEDALATAVRVALAKAHLSALPDWTVEVASTVPTGRGLGSSAAVAVALVHAVGRAAGRRFTDSEAGALAFEAERITHGTPSGIDNTVIALARPIRFAAGQATPLTVREPLALLIADSGTPGDTGLMVAGVRARREARPQVYEDWLARIGRLVEDASSALAQGNAVRLGRLMDTNHLLLQALRVSTPRLDQLVAAARAAGALGAKLSGAGGGGVVIALVPHELATTVSQALTEAGATQVLRTLIEVPE